MPQQLQRRQTTSDERRAMVLEAAQAVFAESGIEGASVREIARRAGYTPGAIYSYFESKEAVYAALLEASLDRLLSAVTAARSFRTAPDRTLASKARAWFTFYGAHPRDLDLGFYLVHGMRPRGLDRQLDRDLNERLRQALQPCEAAMLAMGVSPALALRENTALFAHGVGLLLLLHTGRVRMFGQSPALLFDAYLAQLVERCRRRPLTPPAAGAL